MTELVTAWHTGVYTDYGFYIKGSNEGNWTRHWIMSSDHPDASQRPKLIVDYILSVPPQADFRATR